MATIADYQRAYQEAQKNYDYEGMAAANRASNALRSSLGQTAVDPTDAIRQTIAIRASASGGGDNVAVDDAYVKAVMAGDTAGYLSNLPSDGSGGGGGGSRSSGGRVQNAYDAYALQERRRIDALEKQRKAALETSYNNARSSAAGAATTSAKNLAEFLAARGLTNSGAAVQGAINNSGALQSSLATLDQNRMGVMDDIETERQAALTDMELRAAQRRQAAEAERKAEEAALYERNRQTEMDTMGRYYGDIAARINELKAQGDPYNMIPYYELMRVEKLQALAEQEAAAREATSRGGGGGGVYTDLTSTPKPTLTAAQARDAMNNKIYTQAVVDAYNYYYGTNYSVNDLKFGAKPNVSEDAMQSLSERLSPMEADIFKAVVDGDITVQEANLLRYYDKYGR